MEQVPDDCLVVAELQETILESGQRCKRVHFGCLPDTWRETKVAEGDELHVVPKGKLLAYLNPVNVFSSQTMDRPKRRRVIDRPDLTPLIPGLGEQFS